MGFRDDTRLGTITYAPFPFGILSRWFSQLPVWWDMWSFPGGYIIYLKSDYTQITSQPAILSYPPNSPSTSLSSLEMLRAGVKGWVDNFPKKKSFKKFHWNELALAKKPKNDAYILSVSFLGAISACFLGPLLLLHFGEGCLQTSKLLDLMSQHMRNLEWKFLRIPINIPHYYHLTTGHVSGFGIPPTCLPYFL